MANVTETPSSPRRSGRARKGISYKERDDRQDNAELRRAQLPPQPKRVRRSPSINGSRNSHEDEDEAEPHPQIIDEVLKMPRETVQEYEGWVELESDPVFFNYILHELGVSGIRSEEVFSMDETVLYTMRLPIYGFIFLFDCDEVLEDSEAVAPPPGMWFSSQASSNSCATVALMNVLMNTAGVQFGDQLQQFRDETVDLDFAHKGAYLSYNKLLRNAHNTFASCFDLMGEDLSLHNSYDERNKRRTKAKTNKRKRKASVDRNSAKHYVAYIPYEGQLWELDGLEEGVVCLGPYEGEWVVAVIPYIRERAIELGLQSNLLALCYSPMADVRRKFAENIASHAALQERLSQHPEWKSISEDDSGYTTGSPEHVSDLFALGLTCHDVNTTPVPTGVKDDLKDENMTEEVAGKIMRRLRAEQRDLRLEYVEAQKALDDDLKVARRRCRSFTSVIHQWMRKMLETDLGEMVGEATVAAKRA